MGFDKTKIRYKLRLFSNIFYFNVKILTFIFVSSFPEKTYTIETVVAAVVGGVLFTVLLIVLIFYLILRHMRNKNMNPASKCFFVMF